MSGPAAWQRTIVRIIITKHPVEGTRAPEGLFQSKDSCRDFPFYQSWCVDAMYTKATPLRESVVPEQGPRATIKLCSSPHGRPLKRTLREKSRMGELVE